MLNNMKIWVACRCFFPGGHARTVGESRSVTNLGFNTISWLIYLLRHVSCVVPLIIESSDNITPNSIPQFQTSNSRLQKVLQSSEKDLK